jgi:hypothetical protein
LTKKHKYDRLEAITLSKTKKGKTMAHNPNQASTQHEKSSPTFDTVQYNDGYMSLIFQQGGEVLDLGYDAMQKYLRNLGGSTSSAIIRTRSGNAYGLSRDVIINKNAGTAYRAPDELPPITLGAPYEIPGVGSMTEVASVEVLYKVGPQGYVEEQIDRPSPFHALEADIARAQEALAQQAQG